MQKKGNTHLADKFSFEVIKTDPDNYKEIVDSAIANTTTERKIGF